MEAPVTYVHSFVSDPTAAFAELRHNLDWERRDDAPRCEYHCNDNGMPYTYGRGRGRRTYQPRPYHPVILAVRRDLEARLGCTFEVCFLNLYLTQRDHLGWHADDSPEMDDARPIASVSLGAARAIQFRHKMLRGRPSVWPEHEARAAFRESLTLESGSLCVMGAGMQDAWEHRIPKSGKFVGERISMVFRGYVGPGT